MSGGRSTSLFHFTKSADILQSILQNSFYPHYAMEDISWLGVTGVENWAFAMVSFCDIPLSRLQEHVGFYGSYGIGLSREWAIRNGLNPMFYVSKSSSLGKNFVAALRAGIAEDERAKKEKEQAPKPAPASLGILSSMVQQEEPRVWDQLENILAHIKPLSGTVIAAGKPVEKDFYAESEWRFVPPLMQDMPIVIAGETWDDEKTRSEYNERLKNRAPLRFTPEDVRYIFVKSDADIPSLVDFMNANLGHLSVASMKILLTRVTSLQHIEADI